MLAKKGSFLFFFHGNTDKKAFPQKQREKVTTENVNKAPVSPAVPPVGEAAVRFISLNESVIPEEDYLKDLGDV